MAKVQSVLVRRIVGAALSAAVIPAMVLGSGHAVTTPGFLTPVKLPGGGSASEPGIDIGSDGKAFVNGTIGLGSHNKMWRSDNVTTGSATPAFSALTFGAPYSRFPGGGDADVVTRDGRVYFLDLWAGSNSIARSDDNGTTWVAGTPFTTLPLSDRQWIGLGKRDPVTGLDTVYVVYHFIQAPGTLMFTRSRDGGVTWDWHINPVGLTGANPGQLVSDGDYVAFTYQSGGVQWVATSTDAGTTWRRNEASLLGDADGNLAAVTMDPAHPNNLYVSYVSTFDDTIHVTRSTDRGANWSFPVTVSTGAKSRVFTWVDARADKVAVVWYEADVAGDPNTLPGTAKWFTKYAESVDGGLTFSVPMDASGATAVKTGIICTHGLGCTGGREQGDYLQVAVDLSGKSLVSYIAAGTAAVAKQA